MSEQFLILRRKPFQFSVPKPFFMCFLCSSSFPEKITTSSIQHLYYSPYEYPVHDLLERRSGIHEAEGHNLKLEGTILADERSFLFARFIHLNLPIYLG